jgi:hypothetical protein
MARGIGLRDSPLASSGSTCWQVQYESRANYFQDRSVELVRLVDERLTAGGLEPHGLLRWCGKRVKLGDAGLGRNEVIVTAKEENTGICNAGTSSTRFSRETSGHIASIETRKARQPPGSSKIEDSRSPRTTRPFFHKSPEASSGPRSMNPTRAL